MPSPSTTLPLKNRMSLPQSRGQKSLGSDLGSRDRKLVSFCLSPMDSPWCSWQRARVSSELPWRPAAGGQQLTFMLWEWSRRVQRHEPVLTRAFHRKWRGKGGETLTPYSDLTYTSKLLQIARGWFQPNLTNWHLLVFWPPTKRDGFCWWWCWGCGGGRWGGGKPDFLTAQHQIVPLSPWCCQFSPRKERLSQQFQ